MAATPGYPYGETNELQLLPHTYAKFGVDHIPKFKSYNDKSSRGKT